MFIQFESSFVPAVISIIVYFTGFMILEPIMPSLMSRYAKPHVKGTASGVFNTSQFLGAFVGGAVGGFLLKYGFDMVFLFTGALTFVWLLMIFTMKMPEKT